MNQLGDSASGEAEDSEKLRRFARHGDEGAFRALVEKFSGLVFGAALRRTRDERLAEEVAQNVFLAMARKARRLEDCRSLGAWLHRAASLESLKALRQSAVRRRHADMIREHERSRAESVADDPVAPVREHLDAALASLPEMDRSTLILHYFDRLSFAEVAVRIGAASAAAAQKRSVRALEKLAQQLRRRGVAVTGGVLAAGLGGELCRAAPAGMATKISASVISSAAAGSSFSGAAFLSAMTTAKMTAVAVFVAAACIPIGIEMTAESREPETAALSSRRHPMPPSSAAAPARGVPPGRDAAAQFDPAAFRRALAELAAADEPDRETAAALQRLMFLLDDEDEVHSAIAVLEEFGEPAPFYDIIGAVFARWAEIDPEAAVAGATSRPPGRWGYYPLSAAWVTWAFADWDAARAWVASAETAYDHSFLFWRYLDAMAEVDPRTAVERAGQLGEDHPQHAEDILLRAVSGWARREPDAAVAWLAENVEDQVVRDSMGGTVIERMGDRNPAEALAYAGGLLKNPERLREVRYNIVWQWALCQPDDAAEYLLSTDAVETWDPHTVRSAGEAIARNNPEDALEIGRSIKDASRRDAFFTGALTGARFSDLGMMKEAADAISADAARTNDSLGGFLREWAARDAGAAAAWVEDLPAGPKKEWAQHVLSR